MKAFRKHFAFLLIALSFSVPCFASHEMKVNCASDNYYVQPGGVYVSPDGIFLLLEGELIQINILCADERGVFVPGSEMTRRLVRCPFCNHFYDPEHPENHKCYGH